MKIQQNTFQIQTQLALLTNTTIQCFRIPFETGLTNLPTLVVHSLRKFTKIQC